MSGKRKNVKKNGKRARRAAVASNGTPRPRLAAPRGAFVAEYGQAMPTSDTFLPWLESWRSHGTTLNVLPEWKRSNYRTQARLEFTDNQHAGGIARLFALYVVGTGPRLKFKGFKKYTRRVCSRETIDYINNRWELFADDVNFASTLRQAMQTLVVDGEAFLYIGANPKRRDGIDLRLLDSQRIGNPAGARTTRQLQDGVYLDVWGNPERYCVYNVPDNEGSYYRTDDYVIIPASQIYHLFRQDLAGQTRGVTWFAAALPLLQQLREYTAAVIQGAKRGAKLISSIETQSGFNIDEFRDVYALPSDVAYSNGNPSSLMLYDAWGIRRTDNGEAWVLPPGTTQKAFDSSQPTAEASAFTSSILGQIGYSLGLPRNKATGSSHEYNFASGRLDNQPFEMLIKTLQLDIFERRCCDRLFNVFYELISPDLFALYDDAPPLDLIEWEWVWPSPPLIDPESTARTNAIRLKSLQTTIGEVWSETHPFSEFDDVRDTVERDAAQFPTVFGLKENERGENTAIDEPKAQDIPHENYKTSTEGNL